ncbi:glycosyltransferase [Acinetobacter johnsonii]|uniref:glycosyltransferase family 2 protein n=1 Tax=Acinetobacter johnsonii TaxID=40214 RepID=UPI001CC9D875|nr:glycosyltransferase family 2 protein [Acinetobacter johnsonii]UBQ37767.1 glycosyltransferase [Acinetobacter johnsonii]
MQKKVAIISPFHNRKEVVERTIKSMCDQDYLNLEIIVWDDASSDGTWEEMERVASNLDDSRLTIIKYVENQGLTAGLNKAIKMTDATYVAIVGSGDICHPKRVLAQVEALETDLKANFCATNSVSINVESNEKFIDDAFDNYRIIEKDLIYKVPFTHGSVMFRRQAVLDSGLYESVFKWCADWDLFLRLCKNGYGVYLKQEYYYRYAMLDGASFNPKKSMEQLECKYLARNLYENSNKREEIIESARIDLRKCVSKYEKNIISDLWKRQIKLIFMGEIIYANELEYLINQKYGYSFIRSIGSLFAKIITSLPIRPTLLINKSRAIARFIKI